MNWIILAVSTANLAVTITALVIAKKKAEKLTAEMHLAKDKVNGVVQSFSRLEL